MHIELTPSDLNDIVIKVVKKINTNATYCEALELSAKEAKSYFAKWADDNFKHELHDIMRDELKKQIRSVTQEVAKSLCEDLGTESIKSMVAGDLRNLLSRYEEDED